MNLNLFYETITGYGLTYDDVQVIYDFKKLYTGGLHFNDKYSTGEQFEYINSRIYPEKNPGLTTTPNYFNPNDDEFDFDPTKYVQILGMNPNPNWTSFIKYKINTCDINPINKSRLLLFNKTNYNTNSGICISLDDGNKFVVEYDNKFHNTFIESNKECLFSLEKTNTFLNFESYYPNFYDVKKSYIQYSTSNDVSDWYIGGFGKYNDMYTGFGPSGLVELDFFILFNKSLDGNQKLNIAQSLLASGRGISEIMTYTNEIYISGDNVITGGIIGSGVTGYQLTNQGIYTGRYGTIFNVYVQSGISGFITGEIISGNTIIFTGITTGTVFIDSLVYSGDLSNFYENNLLLTPNNKYTNLDNKDFIEVYGLRNTGQGYPYNVYYDAVQNSYKMLNYTSNNNIYFFLNGLLQNSGVITGNATGNYYSVSGTNIYSNLIDQNDYSSYSFYTGSTGITTGITGVGVFNNYIVFTGNQYYNSDVFLNGQKLVSGINFDKTGSHIRIYKTGLVEGELSFYPKIQYRDYITGNLNTLRNASGIAEEYIWLNGVRMEKDFDYKKISCLSTKNAFEFNQVASGELWSTFSNGFFELI